MKLLIAHPNNEAQMNAIKAIFELLQVKYSEESGADETDLIISNPAMVKHLNESIEELNEGKTVKVSLDDIWK